MKPLHFIFLSMMLIFSQHGRPFSIHDNSKNSVKDNTDTADVNPYQIIISEIMADPHPCVLLPDAEYIELYNRGTRTVNISGWNIVIGSRSKSLPFGIMEPGSFLILCDSEWANALSAYGNIIPVEGMPSILNGGQTVTLKNQNGSIIHSVSFSGKWFISSFKKEGGWSLEIIDPDNPCGTADNWNESNDHRGGTPGSANSIRAENPDNQQPKLLQTTPVASNIVKLYFNESMDSASMMNPYNYSASHGFIHPNKVELIAPDYKSVNLNFSNDFDPDKKYVIVVLDSLKDCAGNFLEKNSRVDFALPQKVDSFDVIINEVLFDASDQVTEFIELYNRSTKVVDLSSFSIGLLDPFGLNIKKFISLKDHVHLLFQNDYVVIAAEKTELPEITRNKWQRNITEVPGLFSLPDDEGVIGLYDRYMSCIDRMTYSRDMHMDLLNTFEGVSLERIRADGHSQDIANWHSASATSGFATPGYQNSQQILSLAEAKDLIISPEIFSPDNDGYDDVVTICLNSIETGLIANVIIFNALGQKIKTLASNTLLGSGNCLIWDGRNDRNTLAGMGIYLIYIELFNANKKMETYKKTITLVKTLR